MEFPCMVTNNIHQGGQSSLGMQYEVQIHVKIQAVMILKDLCSSIKCDLKMIMK